MNRTLSIIFILLNGLHLQAQQRNDYSFVHNAIVRGDTTKKQLAIIFTADEFGEGLPTIIQTLSSEKVKAGFFFTGRFYRNSTFQKTIQQLKKAGHYLGPHSDQHLLYCDWAKRDSLLVTNDSFTTDIHQNITAMKAAGVKIHYPICFIPPYEWWNDSIASWSGKEKLLLFNFTPGTRTAVDYTWPNLENYKSSDWIINWLKEYANTNSKKLNGAVLLIHAGTDPRRKDKLYIRLREIIRFLKEKGYQFKRIDELITLEEN